jgi:hypothetical protein
MWPCVECGRQIRASERILLDDVQLSGCWRLGNTSQRATADIVHEVYSKPKHFCMSACRLVCICVCMYVCIFVCVYACVDVCMNACLRAYVYFISVVHRIKSVCTYRAGPTSSRNPRQKRSQLVRVITNHPVDAFVHCTFWINISDDQTSSCLTAVTAKQIESNVIGWGTKWPLAVMEANGEKLQHSCGGRSGDIMRKILSSSLQ